MPAAPPHRHTGPKGDRVWFTKGKYKGLKGWICGEKGYTAKQVYVVIEETAKYGHEIRVRVSQDSIELATIHDKEPNNYVEAVLRQHKDIDMLMNKLVEEMSKCRVTSEKHQKDIMRVIKEKLLVAELKQHAKASSALWRYVKYVTEEGEISE